MSATHQQADILSYTEIIAQLDDVQSWGRMGGHHELFITKFEGDLALKSP